MFFSIYIYIYILYILYILILCIIDDYLNLWIVLLSGFRHIVIFPHFVWAYQVHSTMYYKSCCCGLGGVSTFLVVYEELARASMPQHAHGRSVSASLCSVLIIY